MHSVSIKAFCTGESMSKTVLSNSSSGCSLLNGSAWEEILLGSRQANMRRQSTESRQA